MSLPSDHRNRELAAIHVAKAQLCMDEDVYRNMLFAVGGASARRGDKISSAFLDHAGRRRVIEHLRTLGFQRATARPANDYGTKPIVPADRQALVDKIEALLADAARPWNYVRAMAKRMCGVDKLEWATAEQLRKLVAALEYDRRRRAARGAGA